MNYAVIECDQGMTSLLTLVNDASADCAPLRPHPHRPGAVQRALVWALNPILMIGFKVGMLYACWQSIEITNVLLWQINQLA